MDDEYTLTVEEVAALLGVKPRQAHRLSEGLQPRLRTKRSQQHNRKLFHAGDVHALLEERRARPAAVHQPKAEMLPAGEMLNYIRDLQQQLTDAAARIGYLQAQLDQQRALPDNHEPLRSRIAELEAQLQEARRPWWQRLLRKKPQ